MENLQLCTSDFNNIYDLVKLEAHFVIFFREVIVFFSHTF